MPNDPGTLANDSVFGDKPWANPGNAASSNNSYATVDLDILVGNQLSNYLKATNFGFAIAAGSTINGITAEIEKNASLDSPPFDGITDVRVRIVKGGVVGATDKSDAAQWPTTDAYTTYGGAADVWGESWTAADINASDFGLVLAAGAVGPTTTTASVDHIRITVTSTPLDVSTVPHSQQDMAALYSRRLEVVAYRWEGRRWFGDELVAILPDGRVQLRQTRYARSRSCVVMASPRRTQTRLAQLRLALPAPPRFVPRFTTS